MKKIFVTGAGGFIGSHLTEKLLSLGYKVKAYIRYNSLNSTGWLKHINIKNKNNLEIIFGDIRDVYNLENSIKNCDYVFHLAALIAIPYSYKSPQSYIETNILGTFNVIKAAQKNKVKKIIHTSSSEVYGTAQKIPIREDHPLVGQSPYAASKIGADQIAISMCRSSKIPIVIVRPFNTFGPRQSLRAVIPTIISQFVTKQKILKIGNLNTSRDFNFVDDICNGFISAMNSKYKNSEIFNLATERDIKIYEIVSLLEEISRFKTKILVEKKRYRPTNSEVFRLVGSCKNAKERLKYKHLYASKLGFKEALEKTYNWFVNNMNLYNENLKKYNL